MHPHLPVDPTCQYYLRQSHYAASMLNYNANTAPLTETCSAIDTENDQYVILKNIIYQIAVPTRKVTASLSNYYSMEQIR